MNDDTYGIDIDLELSLFNKKINEIKKSIAQIKDIKINVEPNLIQRETQKIQKEVKEAFDVNDVSGMKINYFNDDNIGGYIDKAHQMQQETKEIGNYLQYNQEAIEKNINSYGQATNEIRKSKKAMQELKEETENINDNGVIKLNIGIKNTISGFNKAISKVKKYAFSLLSIRGIYSLLSKAGSAYLSQDTELATKLQAVWIGLGAILEPIISAIANTFLKAVKYINIFITALTGVDYISKATQKSLNKTNKSAKGLSKTLAGFDELNNLDTSSSAGTIDTSWIDAYKSADINTEWAEKIRKFGEWVKENKEGLIAFAITIGTIIGMLKIAELADDVLELGETLKKLKEGFDIVKDFLGKHWKTILGASLVIAGISMTIEGLINYLNDPSWENFGQIISGISLAVLGLGIVIGAVPLVIAGVIGVILGLIASNWESIKNFFQNAYNWFEEKINNLPGPIRQAANTALGIVSGIVGTIGAVSDGLFKRSKRYP